MGWRLNLAIRRQSPCHQGSSPGSASVGTAQEPAPQRQWGVITGLEQTPMLTCSCEEKQEIFAMKCGTVWNSQFVTTHREFKNKPSFKGNFCDGTLRKNRPLSSKNCQASRPAPEWGFDNVSPFSIALALKIQRSAHSPKFAQKRDVVKAVNEEK